MSDGPHRSLPMRRHWRDLAERAATPAYIIEQVSEAIPVALMRDFQEVPLSQIREILVGSAQTSLVNEDKFGQLEAVRRTCRGSAAANVLIDCGIEAIGKSTWGGTAFKLALTEALASHLRAVNRQIEEHCRRIQPSSTANIRERLQNARSLCEFRAIASGLMSEEPGKGRDLKLQKRTGVDEGPRL